jgi:hypothetical protein
MHPDERFRPLPHAIQVCHASRLTRPGVAVGHPGAAALMCLRELAVSD